MAGKKIEVLEGEIGQLKSDLEGRFSDFQDQISTNNGRMEGRFAVMEDMLNKLLEVKTNSATSEARETNDDYGRGGNPNLFRGRRNTEAEILEDEDDIPPLEPLSREEVSMGYGRMGADFEKRGDEFDRRGANFERRREEFDEGNGSERRKEDRDHWGGPPFRAMGGYGGFRGNGGDPKVGKLKMPLFEGDDV